MAIINTSLVAVRMQMASSDIAGARQKFTEVKNQMGFVVSALSAIPTKYADLLETVNAIGYATDTFTEAMKAQLDALTLEFGTLNAEATIVRDWLSTNTTEF